ncbi:MAG: hypothetical protein MK180_09365 [Rhodobacteraceae bacterium]|nr:hypothetical protein [Paracoccaceae bacterium]
MASPGSPGGFSSGAAQSGAQSSAPVGNVCEPCKNAPAEVRVEAHYDDLWQTPVTEQPLIIEYTDGEMIDAGGETRGVKAFGQEDGSVTDDIRPDLESYETVAPHAGGLIARIEPQGGADPLALEREINADIAAFIQNINQALLPWREEWEKSGYLGLFQTIFEGIWKGGSAWLDDEAAFWDSVGTWISDLPEKLGAAWDSVSEGAKQIWENRDKVLGVLRDLAEGFVNRFEDGLAALADLVSSIPGFEELGRLL